MYIGHIPEIGSVALTGVGVCFPLIMIVSAFAYLFGMGGAPRASIYMGKKQNDMAEKIMGNSFVSLCIIAILLTIAMLIGARPLLYLFGASANTIGYAMDYIQIYAIGTIFVQLTLGLNAFISCQGFSLISMFTVCIGAVTNIVLDPIFILNKGDKLFGLAMPFGTGQGVAGAAIATVIGNVVSVVFFLIYFLRGKSILSISPGRYRVRGGIARGVITVGLPAAINSLLMSISNMLINVFLQAYGDNAVAAMGITMKANMLVVMLQLGLAQGVQPLVGYCYGANKLDRMRHSIRFSCVCNIVLGTVITVIYFIFTRQVVSVFIDDPAVIDYGVKMLRALMISGPVIGCMFVLNFSFQGMGKGTQSMILSLSRQGLIYFPLLIIMNKTVGLDGIIWSQAVADLVCTAMSVVMFLLVVRKLRRQHSQKTEA